LIEECILREFVMDKTVTVSASQNGNANTRETIPAKFDIILNRLKHLTSDFVGNLNLLTALAGEMLKADTVFYDHLIEGGVRIISSWNATPELENFSESVSQQSYYVVSNYPDDFCFLTDMQNSEYKVLFPEAIRANLQAYIGHKVYFENKCQGFISFLFNREYVLTTTDKRILELIAVLIGIEESRALASESSIASEVNYRQLYSMLRLICDNEPDMIWAKDNDKKYIFANQAICDGLLEATNTDEPIGKTDMFFAERARTAHSENPQWHTFGEICRDTDQITMDAMSPQQFDEYGNIKGNFLRLDVHKAPFQDTQGNLLGTVGSARDVTKDKEKEQALLESQARYKALLDANPDMMFLFSAEGIFLEYKAVHNDNLLTKPEHFIGKYVCDVLPTEVANLTLESINLARQTGEIQTFFYDLVIGEPKHFECRLGLCGSSEYLAIVRDITEQKTFETKLKSSEEKYRKIFETANEGIISIDENCVITLLNQKTAEMFGYTIEEIKGKNLEFFMFEEDMEEHEQRIAERASGKKDSYERRFRRKDGSTLWTIVSANPELDENGNFKGSFGMLKDITDRKTYEAKLKESEARFRRLFETANEGIWGVDSNSLTSFVNHKMAALLGYTVDEMLTKKYTEFIFPEDLPDYKVKAEERKAGKTGFYERKLRKRDGGELWFTVSATPVIEADGIGIGSFAMYTDITERKQQEKALQDALDRYQQQRMNIQSISMSPNISTGDVDALAKEICVLTATTLQIDRVSVWLIDESRISLICKKLYDKNSKELTSGMILREDEYVSEFNFLASNAYYVSDHPSSDPVLNSLVSSYLKPNNISAMLDAAIKSQGANLGVICLEFVSMPHHWEQDEISYACQLADQMSLALANQKRITAELELHDSEYRYRQISELSPIGIAIHTGGKIVYANPASALLMGANDPDEVMGMEIKDIIHPDILAATIDRIKRLVAGEKGLYPNEEVFIRVDGKPVPVEVISSPIEYHNKPSFQVMVSDITARKQMTEDLIKAKDEAEQMNRAKSAFLANMSHELRTPLVGILGYSELLTNMVHDEEIQDMANTINVSGKRLLHTLNLILDLSRVEANQQEIRWEVLALKAFMRDKVKLFEIVAQKKGLALSFSSPGEEIYLKTDSRLLDHVISDLINNAIKYTDYGNVVVCLSIEQTISGDEIQIKVIDTGIGIPQKQQGIIFDAFRQASEGLDRTFEGTGLGLTISKRYTEMLGGKISLQSKVGSGSTFTVSFPEDKDIRKAAVSQADSTISKHTHPEHLVAKSKLPKILLVDDDEISYILILRMLKGLADLDYAENGLIALDSIHKTVYDMVLLDINLPKGVSGLDVLLKLKKMNVYQNVPIVAITAYSMQGDKESFLAKGCSHYLSKPFSKEELVSALNLI